MKKIKYNSKSYTYAASDESFLSGIMYRILVNPLMRILPYHIPANIITIISISLVFGAFFIAMQAKNNIYIFWFMIPVCIVLYITGDYADGEQARRSKTSSPLGEFLDHFLDSFVTALLICMMLMVYNIQNPILISISITLAYFTQASAFWERYKNGHMMFTKFSSTETILSLTAVITVGGFKAVRTAAALPVLQVPGLQTAFSVIMPSTTLQLQELVLFIMWGASLISTIATLFRTKGASPRYFEYLIIGVIMSTLTATIHTSHDVIISTLVLFHVNYICSLLASITMKKKDKHPDLFLAGLMIIMTIFKIENDLLCNFYFLYVLTATGIRVSLFFHKNKHYWYWINPEPEDVAAKAAVAAEGNTSQY